MADETFPETTREMAQRKVDATPPEIMEAWRSFSRAVFKPGALDGKTKQIIAIAVAHVTQCPYCIRAHTEQAVKAGASENEIMEAIWVAAEMRAGAGYAHGNIAMDEIMKHEHKNHAPVDGSPQP